MTKGDFIGIVRPQLHIDIKVEVTHKKRFFVRAFLSTTCWALNNASGDTPP